MNDYKKICYRHTFLNQVIIRCDFLEMLQTEKVFSDETQKEVLKGFPKKGKSQIIRFEELNVSVGIEPDDPIDTNRSVKDGIQITFEDSENNKLILSNKFLICEINTYKTFEKIIDRFEPILRAIFFNNKVTIVRTGIRYINIFESDKLKIKKKFFTNSVAASFENKLPININGIECIRSIHTSEYSIQGMRLNFKYGLFNPDYPNVLKKDSFALDYDCYLEEAICNIEDVLKYIHIGHDAIQSLFENSITDSLREIYSNE